MADSLTHFDFLLFGLCKRRQVHATSFPWSLGCVFVSTSTWLCTESWGEMAAIGGVDRRRGEGLIGDEFFKFLKHLVLACLAEPPNPTAACSPQPAKSTKTKEQK
jgi:hypothetical protein